MKRVFAFIALLCVFLIWTFPHRIIVERMLRARLAKTGVVFTIADVSPCWPPGYKLSGVDVGKRAYTTKLDEIRLGFGIFKRGLTFSAAGCGGHLTGRIDHNEVGRRLSVDFIDIDPSSCAKLDALVVGGTINGSLELVGLGKGRNSGVIGRTALAGRMTVDAVDGTVSGHLPSRAPARHDGTPAGMPIGTWEFGSAHFEAHLDDGKDLVLDAARAEAEGVAWRLPSAKLVGAGAERIGVNASLETRRLDDSGRSKAIIGLLPKAGENKEGWRRYKISGTLDEPKIIGLR